MRKNTYFQRVPALTDGIFETGAYGVPSKSQNPTKSRDTKTFLEKQKKS